MSQRNTVAWATAIGSFFFTALVNADRVAKFLGIVNIPKDTGELLMALSQVPTLLSWLIFLIGLGCLAYLYLEQLSAVLAPARRFVSGLHFQPPIARRPDAGAPKSKSAEHNVAEMVRTRKSAPEMEFGSPVQRAKSAHESFWHIPIKVRSVDGAIASFPECKVFLDRYESGVIKEKLRMGWGDTTFEAPRDFAELAAGRVTLMPVAWRSEVGDDRRAYFADARFLKNQQDRTSAIPNNQRKYRFRLRVVGREFEAESPHFYLVRCPRIASNGHFVVEMEYEGEGTQDAADELLDALQSQTEQVAERESGTVLSSREIIERSRVKLEESTYGAEGSVSNVTFPTEGVYGDLILEVPVQGGHVITTANFETVNRRTLKASKESATGVWLYSEGAWIDRLAPLENVNRGQWIDTAGLRGVRKSLALRIGQRAVLTTKDSRVIQLLLIRVRYYDAGDETDEARFRYKVYDPNEFVIKAL